MRVDRIRNFCIIAHIDHGKSTLADRLLERTATVSKRDLREQYLDGNAIERERGITIKAKAVEMLHTIDGIDYQLNLIDTPGHVDFNYEVSRSLAACEGAILLVDCTQGVQAQTVANFYLALEGNLEIVPVINKIDLASAQIDETLLEMHNTLGIDPDEVIQVSAKEGKNIDLLLETVVKKVPAPTGDPTAPLQALIFDSVYDEYRAVIAYVRVRNGTIKHGQQIRMLSTDKVFLVEEVGKFKPGMVKGTTLTAGEVGFVIAGIKNLRDVRVGDTVTLKDLKVDALPGFREPLAMVFCGIYPTNNSDFATVKKSLERLSLNDSAFTFAPETSQALGFGFRCGFLGLLHMEIVQERLEREMNVEVLQTAPNVTYEVVRRVKAGGEETVRIDNPADLPEESMLVAIREPITRVSLIIPSDCVGGIMKLCLDRHGEFRRQEYLSPIRVMMTYDMPFAEIIYDFYDKMKSFTRGYGTMDYQILEYRKADLVQLNILVGGVSVDALSSIVHRDKAEHKGRRVLQILRKEIPRHMFEVALQAAIGNRVVARENIKPLLKDVIAKCYGGDISRKRKLLEKQKEGKKKMKNVGNVEIPQRAFMAVLKADQED